MYIHIHLHLAQRVANPPPNFPRQTKPWRCFSWLVHKRCSEVATLVHWPPDSSLFGGLNFEPRYRLNIQMLKSQKCLNPAQNITSTIFDLPSHPFAVNLLSFYLTDVLNIQSLVPDEELGSVRMFTIESPRTIHCMDDPLASMWHPPCLNSC